AEQHLAGENAGKRVRRLAAELEEERGRVEEAEAAAEAAQRAVDVAQLADLDAELQERDAALVWDMADTGERWEAERKTISALLARAHAIDSSLRPFHGTAQAYQAGSRNT